MNERISPLPAGAIAPNFTLHSTAGASVSLDSLQGSPVVLVFYPRDWDPVSREELMLFQEFGHVFGRVDGHLLGISTDPISSHMSFARAARIHFPLLSDYQPRGEVARRYGVYRETDGVSVRALIVIDSRGIVRFSRTYPDALNPGINDPLTILESLAEEEAAHRDDETPRTGHQITDREEERWPKDA